MSEECDLRILREISTKEKSDRETEEVNSISRCLGQNTSYDFDDKTKTKQKNQKTMYFEY